MTARGLLGAQRVAPQATRRSPRPRGGGAAPRVDGGHGPRPIGPPRLPRRRGPDEGLDIAAVPAGAVPVGGEPENSAPSPGRPGKQSAERTSRAIESPSACPSICPTLTRRASSTEEVRVAALLCEGCGARQAPRRGAPTGQGRAGAPGGGREVGEKGAPLWPDSVAGRCWRHRQRAGRATSGDTRAAVARCDVAPVRAVPGAQDKGTEGRGAAPDPEVFRGQSGRGRGGASRGRQAGAGPQGRWSACPAPRRRGFPWERRGAGAAKDGRGGNGSEAACLHR